MKAMSDEQIQQNMDANIIAKDPRTGLAVAMVLIRMRCPACNHDHRFIIDSKTPLPEIPSVTKQVMRCKCSNHVPKIDHNTPLEGTLMSINAIPFRELKKRLLFLKDRKSFKKIDGDLN